MARGFFAELQHQVRVAARENERAQRVAVREHHAAVRLAEQTRKAAQRMQAEMERATAAEMKRLEKEARESHIAAMEAEVDVKRSAVRLLSMHTAKGLEFPCVGVGGLGAVGRHGEEIEDCVRIAYVAVTRATHEVLLTYSHDSAVVRRLIA